MGLLSRVADSQNNSDIIKRKKKNLIEEFFLDVKKLPNGFEYSGKLFELLCRCLDIKKGALLIPDKDSSTFFPVSFLNTDMTTTRHLRIERIILETQFHYYNEIITHNNSQIKLFKQFFSIREFSALNSLMLVPFYIGGILNSLLFIIDPNKENVEIAREISSDSERFITKLLNSRKPFSKISMMEKKDIDSNPVIVLQEVIDKNITTEEVKVKEMEKGNALEPFARKEYQKKTGLDVEETGIILNPLSESNSTRTSRYIVGSQCDEYTPLESLRLFNRQIPPMYNLP